MRKQLFLAFQESEQQAELRHAAEAEMMACVEKEADKLVFRDTRLRHSELMRHWEKDALLDRLVASVRETTKPTAAETDARTTLQIRERLSAMIASTATPTNDAPVS